MCYFKLKFYNYLTMNRTLKLNFAAYLNLYYVTRYS